MAMDTADTTADSWNRVRDKQRVEATLGIPEHAGALSGTAVFTSALEQGLPVARGYTRVVYGDHGPYIEFDKSHVCWDSFRKNDHKAEHAPMRYYDEWHTPGGSVMLFDQLRDVKHKKNPPQDGHTSAVSRNRQGGYADYVV
eukprot:Hpha_TRINITY_DN31083_c0_g1::TRINITY_DN31083_c0_g1_i1::g.63966::m.63966